MNFHVSRKSLVEDTIQSICSFGFGEKYSSHGIRNPVRDTDQKILTMLVKLREPKKVLELGTGYGLSALCMYRGKSDIDLTTIEKDPFVSKEAEMNFQKAGTSPKVLCGEVGEILEKLKDSKDSFDFLFLDHEKSLYLEHFKKLNELGLLTKNAVVIAHNVIDRELELHDFIQYMFHHYESVIINTGCGMLVSFMDS